MAIRNFVRDKERYILFANIYHRFESPVQKRKAMDVIETAISCYSKKGFEQTTLSQIASEHGISLSTLKAYFSKSDELKIFCFKYIRLLYQSYVVVEVEKAKSPEEAFNIYFDSCFRWPKYFSNHSKVWLSFLYNCAKAPTFREINTESVNVGFERLLTLVQKGIEFGQFKCENPESVTRFIHLAITGLLMSEVSENIAEIEEQRNLVKQQCFKLLEL